MPVRAAARRNMIAIVAILLVMIVAVLPSQAFANAWTDGGSSAPVCATSSGTQIDYTTCLPSGRWAKSVGSITSRIEPSDGIIGFITNVPALMGHTTRQMLPNMLMLVTQVCWSSALALSQFAASFSPMQAAGAQIDHAAAQLINDTMDGAIPAAIMVVAIVAWLLAAGFEVGSTKEASKRLLASVLCLAALITMGAGASKTAENATTPATGSPWWVVNTINGAVNKLTVGLNLDGLNDGDSNMMAYNNTATGQAANCQDYLYAMHKQYDEATSSRAEETSAVTKAVNRLWEETALRSWVTMQWGNPAQSGTTPAGVAKNAQQAYCHVMDMSTNTDPAVQQQLTNAATGLHISSDTARWLFSDQGWIDPQSSYVNTDEKTQNDRDKYVRLTRAGVFWETCTTQNGRVATRDGWTEIIKNMGDDGTGKIKNGSTTVRVGKDDIGDVANDNFYVAGASGSHGDDPKENVLNLCRVAFGTGTAKNGFKAFNHGSENDWRNGDSVANTNIADAANLGWRFDIPNLGASWNEANVSGAQNPETLAGSAKVTLDYLYGNADPDLLGAFGSVVGGLCNMVVWGLFSLILILTKLTLVMMGLFLIVAFLVRAFPIGEKPKSVLKNWVKYTCNLSMTGVLYSAMGTIATFICSLTLRFCSGLSSSFVYSAINGIGPVLALLVIAMFFSQVLKISNPFSIKAMMGIAAGGLISEGILTGFRQTGGLRNTLAMGRFPNGRGRHGSPMSSRNAGGHSGSYGPTEGETKLDSMTQSERKELDLDNGGENLYGRSVKDFDAIHQRGEGSLSDKLGRMGENTVRGSLAGTTARFGNRVDNAHAFLNGGLTHEERLNKYMQSHPGMDLTEAERHVSRRDLLSGAGHALGAGAMLAGAGARAAVGALRSRPLRDVAKRTAKVAATGLVAAAAWANPITAPAALALGAKLATDRDALHGAALGLGLAGRGLKTATHTVSDFAFEKLDDASHMVGDSHEQMEYRNRFAQQGGTEYEWVPADTTPIPNADGNNLPNTRKMPPVNVEPEFTLPDNAFVLNQDNPFNMQQTLDEMHDEDGNLTPEGQKAYAITEYGMLNAYKNQEHMTQEEAEAALEGDRITGKVSEGAAHYYIDNIKPKLPNQQQTPVAAKPQTPTAQPFNASQPETTANQPHRYTQKELDAMSPEERHVLSQSATRNREQYYDNMAAGAGEAARAQGQQQAYQTLGTTEREAAALKALNDAASGQKPGGQTHPNGQGSN